MHLVFMIRGLPQHVALWKAMAQNLFFKWRRFNKTKDKEEIFLNQTGLRDHALGTMELTFPREALPTLLSIMGLEYGNLGVIKSIMSEARVAVLRKILGLKKIPKKAFKEAEDIPTSIMFDDLERGFSDLSAGRVSIHPIGIKEDEYRDYDDHQGNIFYQEMI